MRELTPAVGGARCPAESKRVRSERVLRYGRLPEAAPRRVRPFLVGEVRVGVVVVNGVNYVATWNFGHTA